MAVNNPLRWGSLSPKRGFDNHGFLNDVRGQSEVS